MFYWLRQAKAVDVDPCGMCNHFIKKGLLDGVLTALLDVLAPICEEYAGFTNFSPPMTYPDLGFPHRSERYRLGGGTVFVPGMLEL